VSRRRAFVASIVGVTLSSRAEAWEKTLSRFSYFNSPQAPAPSGGYAQAVEVPVAARTLYISGQIPVDCDGRVPGEFGPQCRLVWSHISAQLGAAGMTLDNLVKVTTYLADRRYAAENSSVRREILGARTPALTVLIAGIYDSAWLLEIEAVAAA
jgi:2-iminobutanoate/2-iminopropanoate deaminase